MIESVTAGFKTEWVYYVIVREYKNWIKTGLTSALDFCFWVIYQENYQCWGLSLIYESAWKQGSLNLPNLCKNWMMRLVADVNTLLLLISLATVKERVMFIFIRKMWTFLATKQWPKAWFDSLKVENGRIIRIITRPGTTKQKVKSLMLFAPFYP